MIGFEKKKKKKKVCTSQSLGPRGTETCWFNFFLAVWT